MSKTREAFQVLVADTRVALNRNLRVKWALIGFGILAVSAILAFHSSAQQDTALRSQNAALQAQQSKTVQLARRLARLQSQLRADIVKSCEKNGNPLREVLQDQLRQNLEFSQNPELVKLIFPASDPSKLDALIKKGIVQTKHQLKVIAPVNCAKTFSGGAGT